MSCDMRHCCSSPELGTELRVRQPEYHSTTRDAQLEARSLNEVRIDGFERARPTVLTYMVAQSGTSSDHGDRHGAIMIFIGRRCTAVEGTFFFLSFFFVMNPILQFA